jgi:hypothetical protein
MYIDLPSNFDKSAADQSHFFILDFMIIKE